ncbi:MAG: hypothetical protein AAF647_00970, partial [Pseudomonadota bacterium]
YFAPFGVLVLIAGYTGLKLGIERGAVTEGAVLEYYAARYLEDHAERLGSGADISDCVGVPGEVGRVWIEVRCTPKGGAPAFLYGVGRGGAQLYAARDGEVPEA